MRFKIPKLKKNEKTFLFLIIPLIISGFAYYYYIHHTRPNIENKKELSVALVSDIHAGSEKESHKKFASVYPKDYAKNIAPVLNSRTDLIITLGDNINDPTECPYAQKLLDLTKYKNILWAKGNHDKECFSILNKQNYYYHDYNNAGWRIIMLDDDIDVDPQELEWLKETLKTDKKVLIATHVPFFSPSRDENTLLPQYTEAERVISVSGNVKYVFMGHLHSRL